MVAKRRLQFGTTPVAKRARQDAPMVIYRGLKPEMKNVITTFAFSAGMIAQNVSINQVSQGTAVNNRIGAKIKIWNIEYMFADDTGASYRLDLVVNNSASATEPTNAYDGPLDRNKSSLLKTQLFHAGSTPNSRGSYGNHRLKLGIVSKFDAASGTTINSNQIVARLTAPAAIPGLRGYFRIWYTDN